MAIPTPQTHPTLVLLPPKAEIPFSQSYRRYDVLPHHHSLWRIQSGYVRTTTWDDLGNLMTLGFWGPGDCVGPLLDPVDPYDIQTLSPVVAHPVSVPLALGSRPLLDYLRHTHHMTMILHHHRMEVRLKLLLSWLGERFGQGDPEGTALQIRLTHQVIAETLGTTRVTVTKLIRHLESQGYVRWGRQRQVICAPGDASASLPEETGKISQSFSKETRKSRNPRYIN